MGLSAPYTESLDIISLKPVKNILGINPMGLNDPRDESLVIVALRPVKKFWGLT